MSRKHPSLDEECVLIGTLPAGQDARGEERLAQTRRAVWCERIPASSNELVAASQRRIAADCMLLLAATEYRGEEAVCFAGNRRTVYRTYDRADGYIEVYIGERIGGAANAGDTR